jgi:hypothetical protein
MDVIASSATDDFHVNRLPELEATGCDGSHVSSDFQINPQLDCCRAVDYHLRQLQHCC